VKSDHLAIVAYINWRRQGNNRQDEACLYVQEAHICVEHTYVSSLACRLRSTS